MHTAQAELAVAQERLRFARDLHDLLGYSFAAITLKAEWRTGLTLQDPGRAGRPACGGWPASPSAELSSNSWCTYHRKMLPASPRASADRTQSVVGTVIDIARCLHPDARLDDLARLLPVQLEFGIPPDLVPLTQRAGAALDRTDCPRRGLGHPDMVLMDIRMTIMDGTTASRELAGSDPRG